MTYRVFILRRAQKEMNDLPAHVARRIAEEIRALSREPRPPGSMKLAGRGGWRIRSGDYRVVFDIDDKVQTVTVLHVGHRKDVYK